MRQRPARRNVRWMPASGFWRLAARAWFVAEWAALFAGLFALTALAQSVVLNELVASNERGLADEDGDHPDWLELYNPNLAATSLAGYGLSDDSKEPFKWRVPPLILGGHRYLLVFASGKDRTKSRTALHANFSLRASGEKVLLTAPDGTLASELPGRGLLPDLAWGRLPDGSTNLYYLSRPTPGEPNTGPQFAAIATSPTFSVPGGFATAPLDVSVSSPESTATVRLSLDGSEPSENSLPIVGPLWVTDRNGAANLLSLIPGTATVNQHTDGWFPPRGLIPKGTVVRARAFAANAFPSPVVTRTWFVGTNTPARFQLPVLSLTTDTNGLFNYVQGIYVLGKLFDDYRAGHPDEPLTGHTPANYQARGTDWERPAHLEFFLPDGRLGFEREVFVGIQGQSSRSFRQKSLGVSGRGGEINYDLFPGWRAHATGEPLRQFANFRLSNSGNDWSYTLLRDALSHVLVQDLPLDGLAYRPAVLYLDGEFWGLHNLREQQDGRWIQTHYGVPRTEVVLCEMRDSLLEGRSGDEAPFAQLRSYISTNDLNVPHVAEWVRGQMDVDNFLLYHAVEIYLANADWPHNNIRYWRRRLAQNDPTAPPGQDGRWRWMLFDTDLGYGHPWSGGYGENTLAAVTNPGGRPTVDAPWSTVILRQLLKANAFRNPFINQMADLLNSQFQEDRAAAVIDRLSEAIAPAMPEQLNRWRTMGDSLAGWTNQVRTLRRFASQRPVNVRQHLVTYFHLDGWASLNLDVQPTAAGRIQVNSLWVDAALPGTNPGRPYPWHGYYFRGIPISLAAQARPGWRFVGWNLPETETASNLTMTLTTDRQVVARFEPIPVHLEWDSAGPAQGVRLRFQGVPSVQYRLQRSRDLRVWETEISITTEATGQGTTTLDLSARNGAQFYRLILE